MKAVANDFRLQEGSSQQTAGQQSAREVIGTNLNSPPKYVPITAVG